MIRFFLALWIPGKKRAKLKKIGIWFEQQTEVGHNTSRHTEYPYYFLISNCGNASNFLSWRYCLLYFWLQELIQKLINKQIVIFNNPSNAPCSFDESIQIKYFKHHSFFIMCSPFTWFNLQIMNFCLWRHIES